MTRLTEYFKADDINLIIVGDLSVEIYTPGYDKAISKMTTFL